MVQFLPGILSPSAPRLVQPCAHHSTNVLTLSKHLLHGRSSLWARCPSPTLGRQHLGAWTLFPQSLRFPMEHRPGGHHVLTCPLSPEP